MNVFTENTAEAVAGFITVLWWNEDSLPCALCFKPFRSQTRQKHHLSNENNNALFLHLGVRNHYSTWIGYRIQDTWYYIQDIQYMTKTGKCNETQSAHMAHVIKHAVYCKTALRTLLLEAYFLNLKLAVLLRWLLKGLCSAVDKIYSRHTWQQMSDRLIMLWISAEIHNKIFPMWSFRVLVVSLYYSWCKS